MNKGNRVKIVANDSSLYGLEATVIAINDHKIDVWIDLMYDHCEFYNYELELI